MATNSESVPFRQMVRATGLAEVWTDTHEEAKLNQFGWRCTNTESLYNNSTLIGNWNEERFDISKQSRPKRLPSQYEHYFQSTYDSNYNKHPYKVPEELRNRPARDPYCFPGHQPELDSQKLKDKYNSFETTQRVGYQVPFIRKT